jgi:flagellar biosynthesis component FlhA
VLCSAAIRAPLRRLTERSLASVPILSYAELAPDVSVQTETLVRVPLAEVSTI